MYPFHEKEDVKKEDNRGWISSSALAAFGALATITIVVITQNYGDDTTIKILLFSIFIVLISGFYGNTVYKISKIYSKKRKQDKLAKRHFKNYMELVIRFKDFTKNYCDNINTIQKVMHDIKNNPSPNPFSQINIIEPKFIQEHYRFYYKRLDNFDGTIDSLRALAEEFESILNMYDMLYIKEPIKGIKNVVDTKVPPQSKESYNNARQRYMSFIMDYQKFAKVANENYKEKEETFAYGGGLFRDFFDSPEEL